MAYRDSSYLWNSRRLEKWYAQYNEKYFEGKLPENTKIWWQITPGNCANVTQNDQGIFEIKVNPSYAMTRGHARQCVLHEMNHISLWPYLTHGPKFQMAMRRLASIGAFDGIW